MEYRIYRNYKLSEIGVGCYALSGAYGKKDIDEYKKMLEYAYYSLGINFYDTANIYGNSEEILGKIIKPFRKDIFVATKFGVEDSSKVNLSRKNIKKSCESSLLRLQTDYLDLFQIHYDSPEISTTEIVGTLEELVKEGKIKEYGLGHLSRERVVDYLRTGNVFSILMEYSAVSLTTGKKLLPLCLDFDVAAIAFSVTGRGILTGKYTPDTKFTRGDIRNIDPLFQRAQFQSALRIAEKMKELGKEFNKTAVQIAISWVLAQPGIVCALTGPSSIRHLEENAGASGWKLPEELQIKINTILEQENNRLVMEQKRIINELLITPLNSDPETAFKDLVYIIETAISLGLIEEKKVIPLFQKLFGLRKKLKESYEELVGIKSILNKKIKI